MNNKPQFLGLLAGLFLAAGLVLSALLVSRAWLKIAESQTIVVTGSARKNVKSDLIIWRGSFSKDATSLIEAQALLNEDRKKVEKFWTANGITNGVFSNVSIQRVHPKTKDGYEDTTLVVGYRLSQTVEIVSAEVERITDLDRKISVLVEDNVFIMAMSPTYVYTQAGEAKVEMLAEATRDARGRAEQIAAQGGRKIHRMRSAKMGVFQITPLHSMETSSEGVNDTFSMEKTITAVVSTSFSLD